MSNIQVTFDQIVGKIKPMHASGQPPFIGGFRTLNFKPMEYLKNAHIPYCRLHDVQGAFGSNRYVDIPNIFRNFDADETDPANYDFAFTDVMLEAMHQYGLKPIFRLGVTIENQFFIKAYRIHPPKDPAKWARICEHIIRHYNEGWADGFHYGIEYWEIWNEPDNGPMGRNQMWTGTPEQYYELYDVTAKHLKKCFGDTIKVGGYGASGIYAILYEPEKYGLDLTPLPADERYERTKHRPAFLYGFFDYITAHNSPIDFFSWHCYDTPEGMVIMSNFMETVLKKYGFEGLESHLNEWNTAPQLDLIGTSYAAASATAVLCAMQETHVYMTCYYDTGMRPLVYCGAFDFIERTPTPLLCGLEAFGELHLLGNQAKCEYEGEGLYATAATDGEKKAILIVNLSEEERTIDLNVDQTFAAHLIDEEHFLEKVDLDPTAFTLKANQIVLIKNYSSPKCQSDCNE